MTPEREELRAGIVRALYGRGAAFKQREAWIVLGAPASGKSGAAVDLARQHGALVVDSDLAKVRLPEYGDGIGAAAVHQESDAIADRILARAIENGDNIVLPRVGRSAASIDRILTLLQSQGYATNLRFVDLPPEKSVRRAMRRFREEGRFVDPSYVAEVGEAPRQTFEVLKHDPRVKAWGEFSSDVPRGQAPRPVAAGRNDAGTASDLLRDNGGRGEGGDRAPGRDDRRIRSPAPGHALDRGVAHTTSGTRLQVRYRVVDAGDLIVSHNLDLSENPAFPRELQPRERGRAAGGEQVQKIAADLNPELVAFSPLASEGAPIVGPDLVVESGNGRTLAIRQAYAQALGSADRYRAYLRGLGFDLQGLREPILVRERLTELSPAERRQFVLDANVAGVARFSATEQAMADAGRRRSCQSGRMNLNPKVVWHDDRRFPSRVPAFPRLPRVGSAGRGRFDAGCLRHKSLQQDIGRPFLAVGLDRFRPFPPHAGDRHGTGKPRVSFDRRVTNTMSDG